MSCGKCVWMISNVRIGSFNLNFRNMAIHIQTYTHTLQCSLASVGFAQARPNNTNFMTITTISLWVKLGVMHAPNVVMETNRREFSLVLMQW